jgi:hypothetical protein
MALSCANDWTKEFMTKGFPELQALYDLYGAKDKVAAQAWLDFPHNYSQPSREFMYSWLSKHLLGKDGPVKEKPFTLTPPKELSVFDAKHPRPKDEVDAARLRKWMTQDSDDQMAALAPKNAESLKEFKRVIGTALRVMVNSELPKETPDSTKTAATITATGNVLETVALRHKGEKDQVPCTRLLGIKANGQMVVWLHPGGKSSILEKGKVVPAAKVLIDAGLSVVAPDLLGTGVNKFPKDYPVDKGFAGYTYGYNRTLLANRVADALLAIAYAKSQKGTKTIHVVGWGEFGPIAILAKAMAGDAVTKTAADLNQFNFEKITSTADPMMLPGALKYGGLGAFLALCAPSEVLVHNQMGTGTGQLSRAAYEAAGAANKLTRNGAKLDDAKVVEWLVK